MKTLIIVGTARKLGNTSKVAKHLKRMLGCDLLNLSDFSFSYYDYEAQNGDDDFVKIATQMLEYDRIILATPVYWYAMSGIMKVFLDRFTDLITVRKAMGRSLAGKQLDLLICSSDAAEYEWFDKPFKATAGYLDMTFGHAVHTWIEDGEIPKIVIEQLNLFKLGL